MAIMYEQCASLMLFTCTVDSAYSEAPMDKMDSLLYVTSSGIIFIAARYTSKSENL